MNCGGNSGLTKKTGTETKVAKVTGAMVSQHTSIGTITKVTKIAQFQINAKAPTVVATVIAKKKKKAQIKTLKGTFF